MTTSSDAHAIPEGASDVTDAVFRLTGQRVERLQSIGRGRNSRVYRAILSDGGSVAVKRYGVNPADPRDRLGTEFGSLQFLWRKGVRQIPQALFADPVSRIGVYEYVGEVPALASGATAGSISSALALLAQLKAVADTAGSEWTGVASEAGFSWQTIANGVRKRLARLSDGRPRDRTGEKLAVFLEAALEPLLRDVLSRGDRLLAAKGVAGTDVLPSQHRTLSSSDFGFHNAIVRDTGELAFVDFEYFGWDDPAKTVADVLLHPAMSLSDELCRIFAAGAADVFASDPGYPVRLQAYYPLFGIKWCLILLNEFLPESVVRRRFAGVADGDLDDIRRIQLFKAEQMLCRVSHGDDERFSDGPSE